MLYITDADFNATNFTIILPPTELLPGESTFLHDIQQSDPEPKFMVIDDNVDEVLESFALVAVVEDVPDGLVCFQSNVGCFGITGATKIEIMDNDGTSIVNNILITIIIIDVHHIHQHLIYHTVP